ncbi:MAG: hypothetical protein QW701_04895 [Candidatus Nezhaarchaeales archaeon]
MLKEVLNVLLREVCSEKLLCIPQNFYDSVLSYIHALKVRKNNEVNEIQRKIWEEEVRLLEEVLKAIRNVRAKKIISEVINGNVVKGLPPEEDVYYLNLKRVLDVAETSIGTEVSEPRCEGKVLLVLKKELDANIADKLGLSNLGPEDVIFINKRDGRMLIDLGLAEEIEIGDSSEGAERDKHVLSKV